MVGILGVTGGGGLVEDLFGHDPIEPALDGLYGDTNDYYNFLKVLISGGNDGLTGGLLLDEEGKGGLLSGLAGDDGGLGGLLGGDLLGGGNPLESLLGDLLGNGPDAVETLLGNLLAGNIPLESLNLGVLFGEPGPSLSIQVDHLVAGLFGYPSVAALVVDLTGGPVDNPVEALLTTVLAVPALALTEAVVVLDQVGIGPGLGVTGPGGLVDDLLGDDVLGTLLLGIGGPANSIYAFMNFGDFGALGDLLDGEGLNGLLGDLLGGNPAQDLLVGLLQGGLGGLDLGGLDLGGLLDGGLGGLDLGGLLGGGLLG